MMEYPSKCHIVWKFLLIFNHLVHVMPTSNTGDSKSLSSNKILLNVEDDILFQEGVFEIQDFVCRSNCEHNKIFGPIRRFSCEPCYCDTTCVHYGICCPSLTFGDRGSHKAFGSECVETVPMEAEDNRTVITFFNHVSLITKCYARTNGIRQTGHTFDQDQVSKCEHPNLSIPSQGIPVSDKRTMLSYRNVFCARCNNVPDENIEAWSVKVNCYDGPHVLLESNKKSVDIFKTLNTKQGVEDTRCIIQYMPDEGRYIRQCHKPKPDIIERCNETGRWRPELYDAGIEKACSKYSSVYLEKYRNLFCFLCNNDKYFEISHLAFLADNRRVSQVNLARVGFSALIEFDDAEDSDTGSDTGSEDKSTFKNCSSTQFYDNVTCSCQNIYCCKWKYFDEDTKACHTSLRKMAYLGFVGCARVEIDLVKAVTLEEFNRLDYTSYLFNNLTLNRTVTIAPWCASNRRLEAYMETWDILAREVNDMIDLEGLFERRADDFCSHISQSHMSNLVLECRMIYRESCEEHEFKNVCNVADRPKKFIRTIPNLLQEFLFEHSFIRYLRTNSCPFVEILRNEFNVSDDWLIHPLSGQRLAWWLADYVGNKSRIRVCLDDYFKWTSQNKSVCFQHQRLNDEFFDTWTTAGFISIICSSISLLCLVLTFITYVLFEQLRTGGGQNIMVLTVILCLAITLYEFAIEQFEVKILCSIFGVLIHYFWLAAVFSMNACTIERFAKLCFPLKSKFFFMTKKPMYIFLMHSFISPFCIVGCNIVVNTFVHGHIGYGNAKLCYINGQKSRIFSFVVPMNVVVLINIVLFFITISILRKKTLATREKNSHTRIGFIACIRLSVVTGAAWIISLFYGMIPMATVGYVFTVLIGLQGVVFFFSIVVNSKVIGLYRAHFIMKTNKSVSSRQRQIKSMVEDKGHERSEQRQNVQTRF